MADKPEIHSGASACRWSEEDGCGQGGGERDGGKEEEERGWRDDWKEYGGGDKEKNRWRDVERGKESQGKAGKEGGKDR